MFQDCRSPAVALLMLTSLLCLGPGESVLAQGVGGPVGGSAVQLQITSATINSDTGDPDIHLLTITGRNFDGGGGGRPLVSVDGVPLGDIGVPTATGMSSKIWHPTRSRPSEWTGFSLLYLALAGLR